MGVWEGWHATAKAREGIKTPGIGVTGSYKPPNMDVGNQTKVLWKKSC